MNQTKCLITGCALQVGAEPELGFAWGDLHAADDALIYNAVFAEEGEVLWLPKPQAGPHSMVVTIHSAYTHFERRGVFVFPLRWAKFNFKANEYLAKWEPKYAAPF